MARRLLLIVTLIIHGVWSIVVAPPRTTTIRQDPTKTRLANREVTTASIITCGWTSANAYMPKTCPLGQACGWYTGSAVWEHAVVCLPMLEDGEPNWSAVPLVTKCVNWGNESTSATDPYSQTTSGTLLCGYSDQKCATAFFPAGPSLVEGASTSLSGLQFTSMFCTNSHTVVRVYERTTNSLLPSTTSSSTSLTTTHTTKHRTTSTSAATSNKSKSTDPSAIAGGVVGGILGVGAVAALVFYLVCRKRGGKENPPPEISGGDTSEAQHSSNTYAAPWHRPLHNGWQQMPQNGWLQVPQHDGAQAAYNGGQQFANNDGQGFVRNDGQHLMQNDAQQYGQQFVHNDGQQLVQSNWPLPSQPAPQHGFSVYQ